MLIVIPRVSTKKISKKLFKKTMGIEIKWYPRKYLFNIKGSNGGAEEQKRPKTYRK